MKELFLVGLLALNFFMATVTSAAEALGLKADHTMNVTSGVTTYSVFTEGPGGDPSDSSYPLTVYLPMVDTVLGSQNYFILGSKDVLDSTTTDRSTMAITFPLKITEITGTKYITAAVKDSSNNYTVVGASSVAYSSNGDVTYALAPYEFCLTASATPLCSDIARFQKSILAYFFLTPDAHVQGEVFNSTQIDAFPQGVYFNLKMSNKVQDTTLYPTISTVRVGDKKLTLVYSSPSSFPDAHHTRVYRHSAEPSAAPNDPIRSYSGNLIDKEYDYAREGEVVVSGLENDTIYYLSLLFVDKYGFGTKLSVHEDGTPLEISELLKKQACFLLTAGFGEEHYIIEYFREFRDSVLAQSFFGKKFIAIYYELAPKYALQIYKSETLRFLVRGVAYTLYFIFNHILLTFISVFSLVILVFILLIPKKVKV